MDKNVKSKTLKRLKILEGQVRGLQKMVVNDKYCVDIITQSQAIKEALSSLEDLLLENHLSAHVIHQVKSGKESRVIKEILSVYRVSKRK